MAGTILELKDACYSYRTRAQTVNAVSHVSQAFEAGLFYAVMGRSGSGKTTLLSLLAGLELPDAGEVLYRDKSTAALDCDAYRRDHAAVIYQSYNLFPQLTAEENAAYPLRLRGEGAPAAIEAARGRLLAVGLTAEHFGRFPAQLSGGEQQRVAIARALAAGSEIVLADEPTGNLDEANAAAIVDMLSRLAHEDACCVIVVTHDPAVAAKADVVLRMSDGCLCPGG